MGRHVHPPTVSTAAAQPFLHTLGEHARARPQDVAIICGDTAITYRALQENINAAAAALTAAGLRPGDRVALVADNSDLYLVCAFAIWRAGGVLATVYPSLGHTDLSYCLASADPVLIITVARLLAAVRAAAPAAVPVIELAAALSVPALPDTPAALPADLRELSLICYTSGSSATPKAVMHSLPRLTAAAQAYATVWHLGPQDRTIVCLPMAWAFGLVTTSMATLLSGGTVIALARSAPEQLLAALTDQRATFLPAVTTIFAKLVEYLSGTATPPALAGLRLCISGGEPRSERAFARWYDMTGVAVHDVYSASECFPVITYDPVADPMPIPGSSGKVVPQAQMRVVDPHGADVTPGDSGEAWWRGPALMLGYWQNPGLTAAALTADGWYRSSDLVHVDPDGFVFVEGRLSDMIIRGGSNISPGEVEAMLNRHESVSQVAVVGQPDDIYGQQVVAVVIPADPDTFDAAALQSFCAIHLARYKVPTRVLAVAALPVHPATGKIDRKRVAADLAAAR